MPFNGDTNAGFGDHTTPGGTAYGDLSVRLQGGGAGAILPQGEEEVRSRLAAAGTLHLSG